MKYFSTALLAVASQAVTLGWEPEDYERQVIENVATIEEVQVPYTTYEPKEGTRTQDVQKVDYRTEQRTGQRYEPRTVFDTVTDTKYRDVPRTVNNTRYQKYQKLVPRDVFNTETETKYRDVQETLYQTITTPTTKTVQERKTRKVPKMHHKYPQ